MKHFDHDLILRRNYCLDTLAIESRARPWYRMLLGNSFWASKERLVWGVDHWLYLYYRGFSIDIEDEIGDADSAPTSCRLALSDH